MVTTLWKGGIYATVISEKGQLYICKNPGESYRENGHVKKRNAIYLGRVVDKENNVFFNKERGVFTYDVITGTYGEADPAFQGNLKNDHRKKRTWYLILVIHIL